MSGLNSIIGFKNFSFGIFVQKLLMSYVKCMDNADVFVSGKKVKISRERVGDIVAKSGMWGANNERLVKWFAASMENVPGGITDFAVMRA